MEKTIDKIEIQKAVRAIVLNSLVNNYAVERVAFGYEKLGDAVPIDLYLQDLHLDMIDGLYDHSDVFGIYIDEHGRINTEQNYFEYVRDLFVSQMERIFADAPKDIRLERNGEEIPLLPRFRKYLFGLLPLFTEVLNVEVDYKAFDVMTMPTERMTDYPKWQKFVTAILLNQLRSGSRIDRYVEDFTDAPLYVSRLIERKGKDFYLAPVNTNYEFAFALFSLMQFMSDENSRIFRLKMLEWERRYCFLDNNKSSYRVVPLLFE